MDLGINAIGSTKTVGYKPAVQDPREDKADKRELNEEPPNPSGVPRISNDYIPLTEKTNAVALTPLKIAVSNYSPKTMLDYPTTLQNPKNNDARQINLIV
jgi:hypothetical protein